MRENLLVLAQLTGIIVATILLYRQEEHEKRLSAQHVQSAELERLWEESRKLREERDDFYAYSRGLEKYVSDMGLGWYEPDGNFVVTKDVSEKSSKKKAKRENS